MIVNCRTCDIRVSTSDDEILPVTMARSVLLDPGRPGDGTGGYFIVMPYVVSMSGKAGPYCPEHALEYVNNLNSVSYFIAMPYHPQHAVNPE